MICRHLRLLYGYRIKEKYEKGMATNEIEMRRNSNKKFLANIISMHKGKYQCRGQKAAHTTDQLSSPHCSASAIQKQPTS